MNKPAGRSEVGAGVFAEDPAQDGEGDGGQGPDDEYDDDRAKGQRGRRLQTSLLLYSYDDEGERSAADFLEVKWVSGFQEHIAWITSLLMILGGSHLSIRKSVMPEVLDDKPNTAAA